MSYYLAMELMRAEGRFRKYVVPDGFDLGDGAIFDRQSHLEAEFNAIAGLMNERDGIYRAYEYAHERTNTDDLDRRKENLPVDLERHRTAAVRLMVTLLQFNVQPLPPDPLVDAAVSEYLHLPLMTVEAGVGGGPGAAGGAAGAGGGPGAAGAGGGPGAAGAGGGPGAAGAGGGLNQAEAEELAAKLEQDMLEQAEAEELAAKLEQDMLEQAELEELAAKIEHDMLAQGEAEEQAAKREQDFPAQGE